jgi:hypothetical protein
MDDLIDKPIRRRPVGHSIPLTSTFLRIWNYMKGASAFQWPRSCTTTVRALGHLDVQILNRSIEAVVERHEALRTRFSEIDEVPQQIVDPPRQSTLDILDLQSVDSGAREATALEACRAFADEKVDLTIGPLFASKLLKLSEQDHVLICALNHVISDGTSLGILDREIWTLYFQGVSGLPFALPELSVQFGDFIIWQQETLEEWTRIHKGYWVQRLSTAPRVRLPKEDSSELNGSSEAVLLKWRFSDDLVRGLSETAARQRTLLPLVFLTMYSVVISRWCKRDEFVLTFVSNARYRKELHGVVGCLINNLRLRIHVSETQSFLDLLRQVNLEFFSAVSHEDFGRIPDFFPEWPDDNEMELYFNWLPSYEAQKPVDIGQPTGSDLRLKPFDFRPVVPLGFQAMFSETADGIFLILNYMPSLFSPETARRFAECLQSIGEKITSGENTEIDQFQVDI